MALPSSGILLAQILVACLDWLLAATVLYALLPPALPLPFAKFLGIYLLAQLAGLASQIPGGLGVFETAILVLVPRTAAQSQLLGALIAYRGIYYLAPLAVATVVLSALELLRMESKLIRYLASLKHWARELASSWHRLTAFIARHGEHFYNFQGLRQYKQKFDPIWTPKYLATPGGLSLPRVIANVTARISGGNPGAAGR